MAGPDIKGSRVSEADVDRVDVFCDVLADVESLLSEVRTMETLSPEAKLLEQALRKITTLLEIHWL